MTSWSIPSLRSLWEKNTIVPVLFTCFCREQNPGLLVFLSVLPSQACDRGLWLHCNVWAVSGEFFPPAQLGTSHPWKRPSYVCSIAWISGALMATSKSSHSRNRMSRMSLSPCSQRAGQGLPASLAPSTLHDQMIVGLCRLLRPSATSHTCLLARGGPCSVN